MNGLIKGGDKMMDLNEVYFFTNNEWYYYDGHMLKLTDKAPKKAIESYKEFYSIDTSPNEAEENVDFQAI